MRTFVVRLFVPVEPNSAAVDGTLRGLVEEIGTTRTAGFAGGEELLAFLGAAETEREPEPAERSSR